MFSSVELIWELIDGGLHSKNYYRKLPNAPYRERYHKINRISDTEVLIENYHLDWTRSEECDMMFVFDGQQWTGKVVGDHCFSKEGHRVSSEMKLLVIKFIHVIRDMTLMVTWCGDLGTLINSKEGRILAVDLVYTESVGVRSLFAHLSLLLWQNLLKKRSSISYLTTILTITHPIMV